VQLDDSRAQPLRARRDPGGLERSGRDHDLVRLVGAVSDAQVEPVVASKGGHSAVQLDRELEVGGVVAQVVGDLVACRVPVRVAGERQPWE
jgi:hypothetical protein